MGKWDKDKSGLTLQRKLNIADDAVNIIHHFIIPKADDIVALRSQIFCSFRVVFRLPRFGVLTAIEFNDEFLFDAYKIGNVVSNGVLSSEFNAQLVVADMRPKFALGGRGFFS